MSAMAEGEDYAPAGRASGGEKLAQWENKLPRESGAEGWVLTKMRNATSPCRGSRTRNSTNERTDRIKDKRTGTARPFPLWRLRSGLCCRPSIQIFGSGFPQARIVT